MAKMGRKPMAQLERARIQAARKMIDYRIEAVSGLVYQHLFEEIEGGKKFGRKRQHFYDRIEKARDKYRDYSERARMLAREEGESPIFDIESMAYKILEEGAVGRPKASLLQKLDDQRRKVEYSLGHSEAEKTEVTCNVRLELFDQLTSHLESMLTERGKALRAIEIASHACYTARKRVRDGDQSDHAHLKVESAETHFRQMKDLYKKQIKTDEAFEYQEYFHDIDEAFELLKTHRDPMVQTAYRNFLHTYKVQKITQNRKVFYTIAQQANKALGGVSLLKPGEGIPLSSI